MSEFPNDTESGSDVISSKYLKFSRNTNDKDNFVLGD